MSREMKNSGIPWIGNIPKRWRVDRLKNVSTIVRGGSPRPIEEYISDSGYNWIKIGDTIKGDKYIRSVKQKIKKEGLSKTRLVSVGDLILTNSMSFGEPYILQVDGCIHDGWVAFSNIKGADKEFLYYYLLSELCKLQFNLQVAGGVVQNLNVDKIASTMILLPSLEEQHKIASFLDRKCTEIDEMITLQEKIVEELKAYKQSVITEAVTKGLNPDVPMKDSGIEWIGEIPEHWKQCRLKNYFHLHGRIGWNGLRSDEFEESSYAYLVTGQDFKAKDIDWKKCYQIRKERYDEDPFIQLTEGDILVTKDGTIGKVAVVKNLNKPACLNSGIFVVKQYEPKCFDSGYVYWLLVSPLLKTFNDFLNLGGTTIIHLYQNVFERMPLVLPPLEEQQAIANHLDKICSEIDSLIRIKESKIDSLKEYKKSIIYEYVTGKKEVIE